MQDYQKFLEDKIVIAPKTGFTINPDHIHTYLKEHQGDVVLWNLMGGCRANFIDFGLGKTVINLETLRQIHNAFGGNVLVVCPLSISYEFEKEGKNIGIDRIKYITNTTQLEDCQHFYITNYERIRKGDIDPAQFIAVGFDEASILRNLDTDTTQAVLETFAKVPYRYVFTATPAPNEYLELINYAEFLGIMDRDQSLTRFFQRDSTTAGNLTLHPRRVQEFWRWMSSWACFITKPSDLGYSDEGYALPDLKIIPHMITIEREVKVDRKTSQTTFISDSSKSLPDAAKEKAQSIHQRLAKMVDVLGDSSDNWIIWHHLEPERIAIQKLLGTACKSVYGKQKLDEREAFLTGFSKGEYQYCSTKPQIAGSGCNFQYHCHKAVYVGIDYKFNDFIQAMHRIYRFGQTQACEVHIIFTDAEEEIYKELMRKWSDHRNLQNEMTSIIKEFGLNADLKWLELNRAMFNGRKEERGKNWISVNNDSVAEWRTRDDNSIDLILTSIPFGNHYEYSDNYNCFGHNKTNEQFFKQMDYLVPNLYRTLKPGRIAAIHVKDRLRYSYQNGTGFSSLEPFSDDTVACFRKHGFHLMSRITIDTDVVRENASTYRLSWTEACKDMTKMGAGLPEYLLIFRKAPSTNKNAYADMPVEHSKRAWNKKKQMWVNEDGYSRGRWQLDAHAHWKSNGERLVSESVLRRLNHKDLLKLWKELEGSGPYDYQRHVQICELLDQFGKLPTGFMLLPPQANCDDIWDDVSRMKTLNSKQVTNKTEKHICPLQLDIIKRIIERFSNVGEVVADPFGGISSTGFQAVEMKRKAFLCELKTEYWQDGQKHLKAAEAGLSALTLFDLFDYQPIPEYESAVVDHSENDE